MLKHNGRFLHLSLLLVIWLITALAVPCSGLVSGMEESTAEEIDIEESIEFVPSPGTPQLINFDIFEDIAKAKALLGQKVCGFHVVQSKKQKKAGKGKKKRTVTLLGKKELGEFTILLAVLNVKTRSIEIVKVHPKLGGKSANVTVEPGKPNGVNTRFRIVYPEHHVVLALKRPVRQGDGFAEVVYTPYSEDLDIPAVREAGLEYLRNLVVAARNDLIGRGVRPRWSEDFIREDVALTLALIEHIDPMKFESGRYTTEKLIHETLVIMGANTQCAYQYATSRAGARGLFQFIPGTYRKISYLYPRAELKKDFVQAMEDHHNAAKASFLLFDADLRILKGNVTDNSYEIGKALASAYNCGSGKTKAAMDRYGEIWPMRVPAETQIYLKKFEAVWKWLHPAPQAP
ncbi:MAG TPA: hypothetical protein VGJ94_01915 [Syntrophorhabdaceae bacterium]|jgi:hypothetical protein